MESPAVQMRVTIAAPGTRGDVQPHVALARALRDAGNRVRLATNPWHAPFVEAHGLEFAPIAFDPISGFPEAKRALRDSRNAVRFWRIGRDVRRQAASVMDQLVDDCSAACQDADAVVGNHLALPAQFAAEKLGIPSCFSGLSPISPTDAFPLYAFPPLPLGRAYNRMTYKLVRHVAWRVGRPVLNRGRQRLGLVPLPPRAAADRLLGRRHPWLYGFSSAVVPKPADWADWRHVTGYWFLDRPPTWSPPAALEAFLEAGAPPVCISFGSAFAHDPRALIELTVGALARSGRRGVLVTERHDRAAADLPSNIFAVASVPFDWLFPRASVVVHHGGAGTAAAGFRAGVPTVTVPFFNEQRFWSRRAAAVGVGPAPLNWRRLTPERLAAAIAAADSPTTKARAQALGQRIRAENGVACAVRVFERLFGRADLAVVQHR